MNEFLPVTLNTFNSQLRCIDSFVSTQSENGSFTNTVREQQKRAPLIKICGDNETY